ncbi:hypothetical protein K474DRAFT_1703779 [Panus rudis PR-1116 ss-1]|nr:hypothetical protein K474DRAFT_1703779 [Panus rudis PR-1116 ss-1]
MDSPFDLSPNPSSDSEEENQPVPTQVPSYREPAEAGRSSGAKRRGAPGGSHGWQGGAREAKRKNRDENASSKRTITGGGGYGGFGGGYYGGAYASERERGPRGDTTRKEELVDAHIVDMLRQKFGDPFDESLVKNSA